mgnify:CR=1 FL=1
MKKIITGHAYGIQAVVDLSLEVEVDEMVWGEMTTEEQCEYLIEFGCRTVEYVEAEIHKIDETYETYL